MYYFSTFGSRVSNLMYLILVRSILAEARDVGV